MVWEQWVLISVFVLGVIASVLTIGVQRKPGTPEAAVVHAILVAILIYLVTRL